MRPDQNLLYYGSSEPLAERERLRAGPLEMYFRSGELRYIKSRDSEIIRSIYSTVRDRNWRTIVPQISIEEKKIDEDSFYIRFRSVHERGDIHFYWIGTIEGRADGTVLFNMEGEAVNTFLTNRTGFCVLHPAEVEGQPCSVEHTDGSITEAQFPHHISPHQPFFNIRSISHNITERCRAVVRFEGDIFEMEDQRNWTDASFKTYCTPLALPYPLELKKGEKVVQRITLTIDGDLSYSPPKAASNQITIDQSAVTPLPSLGLSSSEKPLTSWQIEQLRKLQLTHLRLNLDLTDVDTQAFMRVVQESRSIGTKLELAIFHTGRSEERDLLRDLLKESAPYIARMLLFDKMELHTTPASLKTIQELRESFPNLSIGGGTDGYFTELNRDRPEASSLDEVCYSLNPQVHTFDNESLVETLPIQAATIENARLFSADKPLIVTPVTLKPGIKPYGVNQRPVEIIDGLPNDVDVRQNSLFGAAWTAGSIKYLSEAGASSLTYFETSGWRGIMSEEEISGRFQTLKRSVYPVYHIIRDIAEFKNGVVIKSLSSSPLKFDSLVLMNNNQLATLLFNFTTEEQQVAVDIVGRAQTIRRLNAENALMAMTDPEGYRGKLEPAEKSAGPLEISLAPFEIIRIDSVL
jgi:D-apionolactonase